MAPVMCSAETSARPERIGKYRILDTLGEGAMGRVYLGEDPHIGRKVAVKVLAGATGDEARSRFLEEARTIGHLSHPEIVTLLEFGFHEGQPFLAMEHLEGESFDRWLERRPPEAEVLRVLVTLCRAIDHAHGQGVLHRDVKPSNLQVLADGRAKLLDFGIARSGAVALTATGMLMGTPRYLAPEVLNGAGHSTASDVYAVGLVAYEALAGENPFAADTLERCLTRVLTETPRPLAALRPDLPAALAEAVMACLSRQPTERPGTLEPLRAALEERLATGPGEEATPTVRLDRATGALQAASTGADATGRRPGRRRVMAWSAGGAMLLVAAVALAWWLAGKAPEPGQTGGAVPGEVAARAIPSAASSDAEGDSEGGTDQEATPPGDRGSDSREEGGSAAGTRSAPAERPQASPAAIEQPAAGPSAASASPSRAERERPSGETGPPVEASAPSTRNSDRSPTAQPEAEPAQQKASDAVAANAQDRPPQSSRVGAEQQATALGEKPLPATDDVGRRNALPGTETPASPDEQSPAPDGARAERPSGPSSARSEPARDTEPIATPPNETAASGRSTPQEGTDRAQEHEGAAVAVPAPAPTLERLSPGVVRRGGVANLVLDGAAFAEGATVEVRRGDAPVPGIRVRRLRVQEGNRIRLTLSVAPDVPLGLYSVIVIGPDGRSSNPAELEISL